MRVRGTFQEREFGKLDFQTQLTRDLDRLDAASLRRRLQPLHPAGRLVRLVPDDLELVNLSGNDYLALADHPHLKAAAIKAVERYGVGSGASRLVTGHFDLHEAVERKFTAFKHPDDGNYASLLLPTGYMANLAVLTTLAGPGDLICMDKLCHASLIDAARASQAVVRVFPHLNYSKLERLLAHVSHSTPHASRALSRPPRRFIVTDSVFSMDGDAADLPALCDLADRFDALLVVDEAHATGVLGPCGTGLCELQQVADRVPIVISTASKAMAGLGGIITAKRAVIDLLVNTARPFIYTTAVPPAQAAVIGAAVEVIRDEPWRRERVMQLSKRLRTELASMGISTSPSAIRHPQSLPTPIIPLVVGDAPQALALAEHLKTAGFLAPAIRPPTVAPGSARVRLSLRADLEDEDLDHLIDALRARASLRS